MRTNVPTPAKSSSPASVEPGVRPLAAQAAASQSSWAAMVSSITCVKQVGTRRGVGLWPTSGRGPATSSTIASSAAVSDGASRPGRPPAAVPA